MKRSHWKTAFLSLLVVSGLTAFVGGCNTTSGIGKDISAAGGALSGSAEKVKNGSE